MYVGINNTTGVNEMLCMLESMIVNTTTGVNEMMFDNDSEHNSWS